MSDDAAKCPSDRLGGEHAPMIRGSTGLNADAGEVFCSLCGVTLNPADEAEPPAVVAGPPAG